MIFMSKLEIISKALEARKDIVVLTKENFSCDGDTRGLKHDAHTVEYAVAPRKGKYSIRELNEWVYSLIPNYKRLRKIIEVERC